MRVACVLLESSLRLPCLSCTLGQRYLPPEAAERTEGAHPGEALALALSGWYPAAGACGCIGPSQPDGGTMGTTVSLHYRAGPEALWFFAVQNLSSCSPRCSPPSLQLRLDLCPQGPALARGWGTLRAKGPLGPSEGPVGTFSLSCPLHQPQLQWGPLTTSLSKPHSLWPRSASRGLQSCSAWLPKRVCRCNPWRQSPWKLGGGHRTGKSRVRE